VTCNGYPGRFGFGWSWPPYSLDLNPCDYLLWGFLKNNVYWNNPHTVEELKREITAAVVSIFKETPAEFLEDFSRRQKMLLNAQRWM
jgi:hypothetical protein